MRKWELITDLFDNKSGDLFSECPQDHLFKGLVMLPIESGCVFVDPQRYPQHFRLLEEPEFTESETKDIAWMYNSGEVLNVEEAIETIRKRKAGKS